MDDCTFGEDPEFIDSANDTPLGVKRLLGINDVAAITGHCPVIASRIIDESQRGFLLHSKKFIFADSFFDYLRELEAKHE